MAHDSTVTSDLLNRGIIYFTGDVTQESMKELAEQLIKIDLDLNISGPVKLHINSPGGDVAAAFGVIDILSNMRLVVNTIGLGEICSCGLLLFLAGEKRYITKNTSILSHQYWDWMVGKHHELKGARKEQDLTHSKLIRYYKERTKLSEKVIIKKLLPETDVWLTTLEALEYNIATDVIENKLVISANEILLKNKKRSYGTKEKRH